MKKTTLIAIVVTVCTAVQAQYSTYYNVDINKNVNQNVNARINQNINVSGTVYERKTITTIDYGALALANSQSEANRLENIKYSDEQQRRISLEVASNPVKAYEYGYQNTFTKKGKEITKFGLKKYTMSYRIPHSTLFVYTGAGRFENGSSDGITTEINFITPLYNKENKEINIENTYKMENVVLGQLNPVGINGEDVFAHKKDMNRATVFGVRGFKSTLIWEDDYQYTITDNFVSFDSSIGNGIQYLVKVRTYGDKNEVTFEQLEGRRYYLRQLIEKLISTAMVYQYFV